MNKYQWNKSWLGCPAFPRHSFAEPALDRSRSHLDRLEPLLNMLPQNCDFAVSVYPLKLEQAGSCVVLRRFIRPPVSLDFVELNKYASCVRAFGHIELVVLASRSQRMTASPCSHVYTNSSALSRTVRGSCYVPHRDPCRRLCVSSSTVFNKIVGLLP